MSRTRPTMADWHKARDLDWLANGGWEMIDGGVDGLWTVYACADPFDHEVHSFEPTLADAIRVARKLHADFPIPVAAEESSEAREARG